MKRIIAIFMAFFLLLSGFSSEMVIKASGGGSDDEQPLYLRFKLFTLNKDNRYVPFDNSYGFINPQNLNLTLFRKTSQIDFTAEDFNDPSHTKLNQILKEEKNCDKTITVTGSFGDDTDYHFDTNINPRYLYSSTASVQPTLLYYGKFDFVDLKKFYSFIESPKTNLDYENTFIDWTSNNVFGNYYLSLDDDYQKYFGYDDHSYGFRFLNLYPTYSSSSPEYANKKGYFTLAFLVVPTDANLESDENSYQQPIFSKIEYYGDEAKKPNRLSYRMKKEGTTSKELRDTHFNSEIFKEVDVDHNGDNEKYMFTIAGLKNKKPEVSATIDRITTSNNEANKINENPPNGYYGSPDPYGYGKAIDAGQYFNGYHKYGTTSLKYLVSDTKFVNSKKLKTIIHQAIEPTVRVEYETQGDPNPPTLRVKLTSHIPESQRLKDDKGNDINENYSAYYEFSKDKLAAGFPFVAKGDYNLFKDDYYYNNLNVDKVGDPDDNYEITKRLEAQGNESLDYVISVRRKTAFVAPPVTTKDVLVKTKLEWVGRKTLSYYAYNLGQRYYTATPETLEDHYQVENHQSRFTVYSSKLEDLLEEKKLVKLRYQSSNLEEKKIPVKLIYVGSASAHNWFSGYDSAIYTIRPDGENPEQVFRTDGDTYLVKTRVEKNSDGTEFTLVLRAIERRKPDVELIFQDDKGNVINEKSKIPSDFKIDTKLTHGSISDLISFKASDVTDGKKTNKTFTEKIDYDKAYNTDYQLSLSGSIDGWESPIIQEDSVNKHSFRIVVKKKAAPVAPAKVTLPLFVKHIHEGEGAPSRFTLNKPTTKNTFTHTYYDFNTEDKFIGSTNVTEVKIMDALFETTDPKREISVKIEKIGDEAVTPETPFVITPMETQKEGIYQTTNYEVKLNIEKSAGQLVLVIKTKKKTTSSGLTPPGPILPTPDPEPTLPGPTPPTPPTPPILPVPILPVPILPVPIPPVPPVIIQNEDVPLGPVPVIADSEDEIVPPPEEKPEVIIPEEEELEDIEIGFDDTPQGSTDIEEEPSEDLSVDEDGSPRGDTKLKKLLAKTGGREVFFIPALLSFFALLLFSLFFFSKRKEEK